MKAVNDLNIPNLVPLEGDIPVEELAEKAGVESDFLGSKLILWNSEIDFADICVTQNDC